MTGISIQALIMPMVSIVFICKYVNEDMYSDFHNYIAFYIGTIGICSDGLVSMTNNLLLE